MQAGPATSPAPDVVAQYREQRAGFPAERAMPADDADALDRASAAFSRMWLSAANLHASMSEEKERLRLEKEKEDKEKGKVTFQRRVRSKQPHYFERFRVAR